jgi:hypothetical protein
VLVAVERYPAPHNEDSAEGDAVTFRMPSWPDHEACTVEVLVIPGCPGTKLTLARIQQAAESLGVETNLRVLTVEREEHARELGFVGSPTVRVSGRDVEDVSDLTIGLSCRLYGRDHAPPSASIRRAIAEAAGRPPPV